MEKKTLLIDENLSGDRIFYEGDTVVFELEATRYENYNSGDTVYFQPGDRVALFRNSFSSLTRFDFLGSPTSIFDYTTIGSDGYARWEYTFLDDGIEEGPEDMSITMDARPHGSISFNLVIDDPLKESVTASSEGIYSLSTSINSPQEGYTLTTTVNTTNVSTGATVYWSLSGTGITLSDFSDGDLTGSETVGSDGSFSFKHSIASDGETEGYETIDIKLFSDSDRTNQVGDTKSILIRDSAIEEKIANIVEDLNGVKQIVSQLIKGQNYTLSHIRDFDGNLHANTGDVSDNTKASYKYQGLLDVNADGIKEAIYTNKQSGRWVTASVNSETGQIDYTDYGKDGTTRIVGIYIDPLVASGDVVKDSDHDSQRRFQNDLAIDNLIVKKAGDFDSDNFQEIYWKTNDGTAYLRALMHADGNIQYANYQSKEQMGNYLISKGYAEVISDIV